MTNKTWQERIKDRPRRPVKNTHPRVGSIEWIELKIKIKRLNDLDKRNKK